MQLFQELQNIFLPSNAIILLFMEQLFQELHNIFLPT